MPEPITDQTPGGGSDDPGTGAPQGGDQQPQGNAPATEYEIDGQKVTADQIREFMKAHKDYGPLQAEFTRKSQLIAKLQKEGVLDEHGNPVVRKDNEAPNAGADPFANNPQAKEAIKILEQMGFTRKESIDKVIEEVRKSIEDVRGTYQTDRDRQQLDAVSANLASKYDGKKGEPKFDLEGIKAAVATNPQLIAYVQGENDGEFLVDLEQTYRNVHADFWGKLPDIKARVVRTERGTQVQSPTPANRKKAETEEERVEQARQFFQGTAVEE